MLFTFDIEDSSLRGEARGGSEDKSWNCDCMNKWYLYYSKLEMELMSNVFPKIKIT